MQSLGGLGGSWKQQSWKAQRNTGPLRPRPVLNVTRAAAFQDSSSPESCPGDLAPRNTLLSILERFSCREFDALLPLLQPGHLQSLKSHASRDDPPSGIFHQVVEAMLELKPEDHFLDSYSLRNLVWSQPDDYEELSHLRVSPDRWVQRFAVTSATSEESVLTFTLQRSSSGPTPSASSTTSAGSSSTRQGSTTAPAPSTSSSTGPSTPPGNLFAYPDMGHISILASESHAAHAQPSTPPSGPGSAESQIAGSASHPVSQPQPKQPSSASDPSPDPSSPGYPPPSSPLDPSVAAGTSGQAGATDQQQERWRLVRVTGEPRHGRLPKSPSPEWSPESVVQAQLEALRMYDFSQVFNLLSPAAQSMVGPLHGFIQTMARNRIYRPLVSHTEASSIRRCQSSRNLYLEIVRVDQHLRPKTKPVSSLYLFIVTKVTDPSSPLKDSWVVDQVKPVQDPKLLQALGMQQQEGDSQP